MKRIAAVLLLGGMVYANTGCAPSASSIIGTRIPELKRLDVGTYDLGEFKSGQTTSFRMSPVIKGEPLSITFATVPESRRFSVVLDDGRVFRFDDDRDLGALAGTRLDKQSFYLEFRQDMSMTVIVSRPATTMQIGAK